LIYVFDFETETIYGVNNKLKTVLELEKGVTYKLDIVFPPGPAHLLHVQIRDALHSVWPTNADADFAGDNHTITFEDEYPVIEPPYQLTAYTWNEDDTHVHRVIIRIGVKPIAIVEPEKVQALYESWMVPPEFLTLEEGE